MLYIAHNRKISCATCRFGKTDCVHVQHLSEFCTKNKSELPGALQEYAQLLSHTFATSLEQYPDYSCLSKANIPFELSSEMSTTLQMPIRERFNMLTDVAELVPCNVSAICSHCQRVILTFIVMQQLLPITSFYLQKVC